MAGPYAPHSCNGRKYSQASFKALARCGEEFLLSNIATQQSTRVA
jgi:hypothetical protein